jgi:hypothetical protein
MIERMIRIITALNINHGSGRQIIEQIHKPQNALMHQKMQRALLTGITPILADIVREGNTEGICDTLYPYECMEMIMAYGNTVLDDVMLDMTASEKT